MLLGEGQPEKAELGVLPPQRAAEALGLLRVAPPVLESIAVGDEPIDALLQEPLFVGEIEVPLSPLPVIPEAAERGYPGSIAPARGRRSRLFAPLRPG